MTEHLCEVRPARQAGAETGSVPVIEFVAPMPGFPHERRFVLVRLDSEGLLFALTSVDSPGLRFLVTPPAPFFPAYAPEIDDETLSLLGAAQDAGGDDLLLLLVVTAGESASEATANLMAPIVLDQRTRRAAQVVLGGEYPVRQPLLSAG
jgi:flagellar assembly factor FliW